MKEKYVFLHKNRSVNHAFKDVNVWCSMHAYLLDLLDLKSIVETVMQKSLVCLESTSKKWDSGSCLSIIGGRMSENGTSLFHRNTLTYTDNAHLVG